MNKEVLEMVDRFRRAVEREQNNKPLLIPPHVVAAAKLYGIEIKLEKGKHGNINSANS